MPGGCFWRLIYDPAFTSAKKRQKQGLQVLDEVDPESAFVTEDDDPYDAWEMFDDMFPQWRQLNEDTVFENEFLSWLEDDARNPQVIEIIRKTRDPANACHYCFESRFRGVHTSQLETCVCQPGRVGLEVIYQHIANTCFMYLL